MARMQLSLLSYVVKFFIIPWTCFATVSAVSETIYMDTQCGTDLGTKVGGRIESSSALTYENDLDCTLSLSAPTGKIFRVWFKRWDMELRESGVCLDYLRLYDGSSTSDTPLSGELCEQDIELTLIYNYTTTQTGLTLHFKTDASARYRGFEILYAAYSDGSSGGCGSGDFACANGICLDSSLECDDTDQCWDNSDETQCSSQQAVVVSEKNRVAILVGCAVAGFVGLLILIFIIYKVIKYYYWKNWLERNSHRQYPWEENDTDLYSYPKTDKYQIFDIGKKGRREPQLPSHFSYSGFSVGEDEDTQPDFCNMMGEK